MRSDIIHVTNSGDGMPEALDQAEAVAGYRTLSSKKAIRLRLLAEEMLGMFRALSGDAEADFWIESEGEQYLLHLASETKMTAKKREMLLSASSDGKNTAAKGFMGKIRDMFSRVLEPIDDATPNLFAMGLASANASGAALSNEGMLHAEMWSLSQYKSTLGAGDAEKWDELEKSVVSRLADEVKVSIVGDTVELTISAKL